MALHVHIAGDKHAMCTRDLRVKRILPKATHKIESFHDGCRNVLPFQIILTHREGPECIFLIGELLIMGYNEFSKSLNRTYKYIEKLGYMFFCQTSVSQ